MKLNNITNEKTVIMLTKRANRIARAAGFGRATEIILGDENKIVESQRSGFRKRSTGEYVRRAYLNHFGWKNTYYQYSHCIVSVKI